MRQPVRSQQRLQQHAHGGFTLLELLISLTLISLTMVILYSGFWLGMRTWDAGETSTQQSEQMRLVANTLKHYLSQALPLMVRENRGWRLQFEGTEHTLRFISPMSPYLGTGGLYELALEVIEDRGKSQLKLTRTLLHPDRDPDLESNEPAQAVLVDDLADVRFSYLGRQQAFFGNRQTVQEWQDEWQDATRIPLLVRLELTTKKEQPWPPLIVAPQVDGEQYQALGDEGGQMPAFPTETPLGDEIFGSEEAFPE